MYQPAFGPRISKVVKWLVLINAIVFAVQYFGGPYGRILTDIGAAYPANSPYFYIWQVLTYQFLHGSFMHIFFNMFILWMFGSELERVFGEKEFLIYYLVCGIGAGILIAVGNMFLLPPGFDIPTLGASGAVLGIMLAYAVIWPDRYVLLMFVFPMKIKYLAIGYAVLSFVLMMSSGEGGVSHVGHLGGILSGALYLRLFKKIPVLKRLVPGFASGKVKKVYRDVKSKAARPFYSFDLEDKETQERVNELLDKISQKGLHSLTEEERQFLHAVSRKNRDKNADN